MDKAISQGVDNSPKRYLERYLEALQWWEQKLIRTNDPNERFLLNKKIYMNYQKIKTCCSELELPDKLNLYQLRKGHLEELLSELENEKSAREPKNKKSSSLEERLRGNFLKKQELITLLLSCPSIVNRASRDNLLREVHNGRLIAKIARNDTDTIDLANIVNTLLEYSGALEELISFVRQVDSGTKALQALETFQRVLLVDSFPSDSLKQIKEYESQLDKKEILLSNIYSSKKTKNLLPLGIIDEYLNEFKSQLRQIEEKILEVEKEQKRQLPVGARAVPKCQVKSEPLLTIKQERLKYQRQLHFARLALDACIEFRKNCDVHLPNHLQPFVNDQDAEIKRLKECIGKVNENDEGEEFALTRTNLEKTLSKVQTLKLEKWCHNYLGVDWSYLNDKNKVQDLIDYCEKKAKIWSLVEQLLEYRHYRWEDLFKRVTN